MTAATSPLLAHVREVARLRAEAQGIRNALAEKERVFKENNADLLDARAKADALLAEAEAQLRGAAEAHFHATGDLAPAPGVKVQMRTTLSYDEAVALRWAQDTKMALLPERLDVKAFEKIAKASPLPFVTVEKVPAVTLATDLDAALAVAEVSQ